MAISQSKIHCRSISFLYMILLAGSLILSSCSANSRQGAGAGASIGGLSGAVGGMVTALVFGGNVGEAMAQGAVWGASTGAVSGAVAGAHKNMAEKNLRNKKQLEEVRKNLGDDVFTGLNALADCKHDIAIGYAKTAVKSSDHHESLAGMWLEVLTYVDRGEITTAKDMYPQLAAKDNRIESAEKAQELTKQTYEQLKSFRSQFGFPSTCK